MSMTTAPIDSSIVQLLERFRLGNPAALARAVTIVENHLPGFEQILAAQQALLGRARRIGLTGPPGAGKSTMATRLARAYRGRGLRVGIVAVDPTSPFTGGTLLGDRIRMEEIALDPGVFIRSMATRGSLGGLATATREVCDVLDGFGMDVILIETVGVGQSELDVARAADSTLVVLVPEAGDSIQTLKAGLMEIADVFVVNKADRPGADRLMRDIQLMLGMRTRGEGSDPLSSVERRPVNAWIPPVLLAVAVKDEGIVEITEALEGHRTFLVESGELRSRRRARLRERVMEIVEECIRQRLWHDVATLQWLDAQLDGLENGSLVLFSVADELRSRSGILLTGSSREGLLPYDRHSVRPFTRHRP